MKSPLSASLLLLLCTCCSAAAQEKPARPKPQVIELAASPAAEPAPALKYRLLPPFLERTEENAAPAYLKALLLLEGAEGVRAKPSDKVWTQLNDWAVMDIDKLPQDEVRTALAPFRATLDEVRIAARREHCDWAMGVRERKNIFGTLLPETQSARGLGRLLAVEARLHIAAGRYDEALRTLQVGYALARHIAQQPFLVSSLVGLAIAQQMHDQVEALIAAPGSPNMYWALAALSDPLIDLRPALDLEGSSLFLMFPDLRTVQARELTPDQWRQEFRDTVRSTHELLFLIEPEKEKGLGALAKELARAAAVEAMLELRYPAARKELLAWGYDEKRLDTMAKGQVALIFEVEHFERSRDELFKWFDVPYWQAHDGMQASDEAFKAQVARHDKLVPPPVAKYILPAISRLFSAEARGQRRIAALQTIESLRMYAAAHEGRWPMQLDDPAAAPIPVNPFTGELPGFTVEDNVATLTFAGRGIEADLIYKLRME